MCNEIVNFKEDDHTYFNQDGEVYISANGVLKYFFKDFDEKFWAYHGALKNNIDDFTKKYFKLGFNYKSIPTTEQLLNAFDKHINFNLKEEYDKVLAKWDDAKSNGTKFHLERETEGYKLGYIINSFDDKKYNTKKIESELAIGDNFGSVEELKNLSDGVYPELLVISPESLICGQADEVFIETVNGSRYFDIGDHKTNEKEPDKSKGDFAYAPITHLKSNNFVKYELQLSIYAYILTLYGYKPRHLGFYHYKDYDVKTKKIFKTRYLENEVKDMISFITFHIQGVQRKSNMLNKC